MLLKFFHLFVVTFNVYSLWYDQMYLDLPLPAKGYETMPFRARLMFLTIWCLITQTVYFTIALLNDFIGSNDKSPRPRPIIRTIKDTLFGLAFPVAANVSINFWGIYYYDKPLIFPEYVEKAFPVWLNHGMHTNIILFMLIELFFTHKTYPSKIVGLGIFATYTGAYIFWIHVLYSRTGAWPYPILEVFNLPARIAFFACTSMFGIGLYNLGEKLNSLITSAPSKKKSNERKKRQ